MKQNRRRAVGVFLILAMAFLTIGIATDNTAFTWIAIVFVLIALLGNSKWLRPRKK
jgi:hypothetical protein